MYESTESILEEMEYRLEAIKVRLHNLEASGQKDSVGYNKLQEQAGDIDRDIFRISQQMQVEDESY